MKTVLIPTDFSENAMHALAYALQLYKLEITKFYFLHAYADEVYGPYKKIKGKSLEKKKEEISQESDKNLKTLLTTLKSNPKHEYKIVSSFDSLVDAINDFVNEINIDIVIMGTKGQTADKKITFGSHTVQVFKYVECPVLAIPKDCEYVQPEKILFPTNYLLPYKKRELKLLNNFAHYFKSEIHCLHISDFDFLSNSQENNKLFLEESLSNSSLYFERAKVENKAKAILEHIVEKNINMLVMINSRHSFIEDMLSRSTVDEIGLTIKIPFLVMQNLPR